MMNDQRYGVPVKILTDSKGLHFEQPVQHSCSFCGSLDVWDVNLTQVLDQMTQYFTVLEDACTFREFLTDVCRE